MNRRYYIEIYDIEHSINEERYNLSIFVNGSYVYYDKPEVDYVEPGITQLYENRTPGNGNIKAGLSETS